MSDARVPPSRMATVKIAKKKEWVRKLPKKDFPILPGNNGRRGKIERANVERPKGRLTATA